MSGRWVRLFDFGPDNPDDPDLDNGLIEMAKRDATDAGYHPTDEEPSLVWTKDLITKHYAARVVVPVTETEPL